MLDLDLDLLSSWVMMRTVDVDSAWVAEREGSVVPGNAAVGWVNGGAASWSMRVE